MVINKTKTANRGFCFIYSVWCSIYHGAKHRSILNVLRVTPFCMPLDALVIAPCTGNTLAKLANGIADSAVTLAVKAHLRNLRPVVIGVSTNDALGAAAQNIGRLRLSIIKA